MKTFASSIIALMALGSSMAFESDLVEDYNSEGRFLFPNFTSGLLPVNSTILAWALIAAAIAGAIAVILYYLYLESQSSYGGYGGYGYGSSGGYGGYQGYQQARSADGFDFNSLNVIQWISMLQDIYEKFDYNDLECQKRLICEVMKEPTYYGSAAQKFKTGFQYAKYLEVLSLPDDMRDLLDEYLDANSAAEMNKECNEFFTCPFSIKDSFKRNLSGNSL